MGLCCVSPRRALALALRCGCLRSSSGRPPASPLPPRARRTHACMQMSCAPPRAGRHMRLPAGGGASWFLGARVRRVVRGGSDSQARVALPSLAALRTASERPRRPGGAPSRFFGLRRQRILGGFLADAHTSPGSPFHFTCELAGLGLSPPPQPIEKLGS